MIDNRFSDLLAKRRALAHYVALILARRRFDWVLGWHSGKIKEKEDKGELRRS